MRCGGRVVSGTRTGLEAAENGGMSGVTRRRLERSEPSVHPRSPFVPFAPRPLRRAHARRRRDDEHAREAFRAFKAARFFGSLDGLRAFSILAVVWYHTLPFAHDTFAGQGNKGVTLFFAISGFLIVTLILRAKQSPAGFQLPQFWGRRALRILPLYYGVLLAYVGLVALFERDGAARATFWGNLPAFATFTSNWFVNLEDTRVIFYFAWSLAAEEQFYLVWPVLERWLRGWGALATAVVTLVSTQAVVLALGDVARESLALRMVTSVPAAILLGVTLAHLLHRPETYRAVWRFAGRRGSAGVALALTVGTLAFAPAWGAAGELAIAVALAGLVATCVVREDNDLARLLRWRPLVWIGTVSYGMYLLHMIAVNVVRRAAAVAGVDSPWVDFVGGSLLAIALASLSYLTFEKFFLRLKDRWFGTTRPPPAAAEPSDPAPSAAPKSAAKPATA
ncbi:MAG: acyltransferase [Opitutus sp.]|nr:acyltransferase [Opitutus sp.]